MASRQKGHYRIYPGRPDKSLLFRKINKNLESTIQLDPEEGEEMPKDNAFILSDTEKEIIRQWILYGAQVSGISFNSATISQFYNSGGLNSFDNPPQAPDPAEGFQIKMGPFFLAPSGEIEYFQKWELDLPEMREVHKMDFQFGNYSHHFLVYQFENSASSIADGLRPDANHSNIKLVAAVQEPTFLHLPNNTAFFWNKGAVLDLNSHYINYSATLPLKAEVYVNVYTQASGTAKHEMKSILIPNFNIPIPNNGKLITFESPIVAPRQNFVWGMMGHTHKYGKDYKVYKRNPDGSKGELIYNASCFEGNPNCASPFFDYRHIPFRKWEPLLPIPMNPGLIHQAQYLNDGPLPVSFGPTSKDEMMLIILFYTDDTTGISTATEHLSPGQKDLRIIPNPSASEFYLELDHHYRNPVLEIVSLNGQVVLKQKMQHGSNTIHVQDLASGMYIGKLSDDAGRLQRVRIIVSRKE